MTCRTQVREGEGDNRVHEDKVAEVQVTGKATVKKRRLVGVRASGYRESK